LPLISSQLAKQLTAEAITVTRASITTSKLSF